MNHQIEQVEAFMAFLDFLENPEKYKALAKEVKQAAAEHKLLVETKRKIKNVDDWQVKKELVFSEREKQHKNNVEAFSKVLDKFSNDKARFAESSAEIEKNIQKRSKELDDREKTIFSLEKEKQKCLQLQNEYEEKLASLQKQKDALKDQAAQIKSAASALLSK